MNAKFIYLAGACLLFLMIDATATSPKPLRPVHTYSIVARDAVTGELGAAVQSHWFSVGSGVIGHNTICIDHAYLANIFMLICCK